MNSDTMPARSDTNPSLIDHSRSDVPEMTWSGRFCRSSNVHPHAGNPPIKGFFAANKLNCNEPELSMGPFYVTRYNPTHDLTQPNPLQGEKLGPNPT